MKTQREILDWAVATWGECARDTKERALRMLEEALELAQAEGIEFLEVDKLAWRVYRRPVGSTAQEIAGVYITLHGLAENAGIQVDDAVAAEWDRINSKPPEYFRAKHAEKIKDGVSVG